MNSSKTSFKEPITRAEIPNQYKWDLSKIYPNWEAWEADLQKIESLIQKIEALKGTFHQGAHAILKWQILDEELQKLMHKAYSYCCRHLDTDLENNDLIAKRGIIQNLDTQSDQRLSWTTSELLGILEKTMLTWIDETPELLPFRFPITEIYRKQKHALTEQQEQLLSHFIPIYQKPTEIYNTLAQIDRDAPPEKVVLSNGEEIHVTPINARAIIQKTPDSDDRYKIQQASKVNYKKNRNAYASIYDAVCKTYTAKAKVRGYGSALEARLDEDNIPISVIENLIQTGQKAKTIIHRYHVLRKRVHKLTNLRHCDLTIPLKKFDHIIDYEEAKKIAIESVQPLGAEYQQIYTDFLNSRSVDVFQHPGKEGGAYNASVIEHGTFVLMNFDEKSFFWLNALTHEMGHAMHSLISEKAQIHKTHHSSLLIAEVASLLGEQLLYRTLRERYSSGEDKAAILELAIEDLTGSLLTQLFFLDYEIATHTYSEKGETLTADLLSKQWNDSYEKYFGICTPIDDPSSDTWPGLFFVYEYPFYVMNFPLSYSAAADIYSRIFYAPSETERQRTVEQYLDMLRSGGNDLPMNQLLKAGVDLSSPEPIENVVQELDRLVTELENYYPEKM